MAVHAIRALHFPSGDGWPLTYEASPDETIVTDFAVHASSFGIRQSQKNRCHAYKKSSMKDFPYTDCSID
jgi:hypothetical protein